MSTKRKNDDDEESTKRCKTTGVNNLDAAAVFAAGEAQLAQPQARFARNMVARMPLTDVLRDQSVVNAYHYTYSTALTRQGKATSQGSSGRCWIFACMNVLRLKFMEKFNLNNDFQLSQAYLHFYDKLERCQYFLDTIISTANEPVDGRLVSHILSGPLNDGGQWDMLVNLIAKYGIVPQSVFPDQSCSRSSRLMNRFLTNRLRTCARRLRFMLNTENVPADSAAIAAEKASMLDELRAQLVVFFGNPPATFTWAAKNKDGEQVVIRNTTPQAFYAEAGFDVTGTVSLINDPRNEYYKLYTVEYLGNTVGGRPTTYINVPIEELKRYARSTLEDNEPVWFGCDMGKYVDRKTSAMDTAVYDYNLVLGASKLEMSKRDRLVFGESLMTHAMVFIGFDRDPADSNRAISWQVENSWGETGPDKGRWILTDDWFDHFVYQIVVENSKLSEEIRAVLDQTPTVLPPWDPMGALASL